MHQQIISYVSNSQLSRYQIPCREAQASNALTKLAHCEGFIDKSKFES